MPQQTRICAEALSADVNKVEAKPPAGAWVPQKWGRPGKPEGLGQPRRSGQAPRSGLAHRSGLALRPEVAKRAPPTGVEGVSSKLSAGPPGATRPHPVDVNPALGVPGQPDLLLLGPAGNPVTTNTRPPQWQVSGEGLWPIFAVRT